MEAPGLDGEGDGTAGEGEDVAGFAPVVESGGDAFRGIEDGPRCAAGDEGAVVEVGAVEEAFGEEGNAATTAHRFDGPAGKADGGGDRGVLRRAALRKEGPGLLAPGPSDGLDYLELDWN